MQTPLLTALLEIRDGHDPGFLISNTTLLEAYDFHPESP
jgi:hypothetical protein